jgi:hypothetical protein
MWLVLAILAVCAHAGNVSFLNAQTQADPDTGRVPKIVVQDTGKALKIAIPDTSNVPNAVAKTEEKHLPIWVNEAIRLGQSKKVRPYLLTCHFFFEMTDVWGNFTTPFLRVAIAASEAKEKFKIFGPSDVTEEMLAPVLIVTVSPIVGNKFTDSHSGAEHVVIKKRGTNDPADAIQPTTIKPFDETYTTAGGGTITLQGLVATFPLNAFREGQEIFFLFKGGKKSTFPITKEMIAETMRS